MAGDCSEFEENSAKKITQSKNSTLEILKPSVTLIEKNLLIFITNTIAQQMGLSLLSTHTLDEMEQWVRSYFSSIKNNNRERNAHEVEVIEPKEAIRIINVNPIKDIRQMNIVFAYSRN